MDEAADIYWLRPRLNEVAKHSGRLAAEMPGLSAAASDSAQVAG